MLKNLLQFKLVYKPLPRLPTRFISHNGLKISHSTHSFLSPLKPFTISTIRSFCTTPKPSPTSAPQGESIPDSDFGDSENDVVQFGSRPIVALVGRPNVGKSTLFNRLILRERRKALTAESKHTILFNTYQIVPGTTRDRSYGNAIWLGREFVLVDTGGIVIHTEDQITQHIKEQALVAIEEAQVVVFLVDAKEGLTKDDAVIARHIRQKLKESPDTKVVLVVNKADNAERSDPDHLKIFERLGFGVPHPIAAINNEGLGDMLDLIVSGMPVNVKDEPEKKKSKDPAPDSVRIAIVGQPNSGKSSFLNKVLKEERAVVSEVAGTTHDPVDHTTVWGGLFLEYLCNGNKGEKVTLIDTAGITRQAKLKVGSLERSTVLWSLKVVERAHVVILLVDPVKGITSQDQTIANHILENYKSVVVAVNKWDLLRDKKGAKGEYEKHVRGELKFMDYVPVEYSSAKTGYHVNEIMDTAIKVYKERSHRFTTAQLNELLQTIKAQHTPPASGLNKERIEFDFLKGTKRLRIKFITQAKAYPPTFILFVNYPTLVDVSYERYIENSIRDRYPYVGTPIRLYFRENERKEKDMSLKNKEVKPWEKYANRKKKGRQVPEAKEAKQYKSRDRGGSVRHFTKNKNN